MTEVQPHLSAEPTRQPEESARGLGETALGHETHQEITLADLVTRESSRIYDDFLPFARTQKFLAERELEKAKVQRGNRIDTGLEKQLMMPKIIYDFVQQKTDTMLKERGQHPIVAAVEPHLPRRMVVANLRQLHFDRAKGRTQNPGDFLAKQEAYAKVATDLSESFPQVLFAEALHDAFTEQGDPKYARYATDVVNAIGRTLRILGTLNKNVRQVQEGSAETDSGV